VGKWTARSSTSAPRQGGHDTPRSGALFVVDMLTVLDGGNSNALAEISDALTQAGFGQVSQIHTDTHMDGLVEAYKPR